jgi:hypothetical protein
MLKLTRLLNKIILKTDILKSHNMKKILNLLFSFSLFLLIVQGEANAQLSGSKTIPGDYASVLLAITDLNAQGVGSGGVTFNIAAGYTDTIPSGGYVINIAANAPTAGNPVIFQKSGTGNNPQLNSSQLGSGTVTSTTLGNNGDAFIKLVGTDYITFNNINLVETYTGTTQTSRMEYGILMVRSTATDGCKNVTISGCTVNLQRTNIFSSGIASTNFNAAGTTTNPTANSGRHENISVQGCTINNSFNGMYFVGFAASTPFDLYDHFYNIGTTTGNTLINIGGLGASTTTTNYGILAQQLDSVKINNNTIRLNNGANTSSISYGIFLNTGTNSCADVTANDIRDSSSGTTGQQTAIGCAMGGTGTSNTVNITNNVIRDFRYASATSAAVYYIHVTAGPWKLNVTGNTIRDNTIGGTGTATGAHHGIFITSSNTTSGAIYTVSNNSVENITRTQSAAGSGDQAGIHLTGGGQTTNIKGNTVDSLYNGTTTGFIYGIGFTPTVTTVNIDSNSVTNLTKTSTATTGYIVGLFPNSTTATENVTNNTVANLTSAATGTSSSTLGAFILGYYNFGSGVTVTNISGNTFTNFNFTGAGVTSTNASIMGTAAFGGPSTGVNKNIFGNTYSNFSGTTGQVIGLNVNYSLTGNVYKNKIYNISGSTTLVNPAAIGMLFGANPATAIYNVYNNFIHEIKAPLSPGYPGVIGMWPNTGTGSKFNMYYNTIYLDAVSSGANFGSVGLYCIAAPLLDMRNNIIVNKSVYNGTGNSVAFYRTTSVLTNYGTTSNNNAFYVTPAAGGFLYADGTSGYSTITSFKSAVTPRESNSFSENTPFVNTSSSPYDLHLSTSTPTACEGSGVTITSPAITDDIDGNIRNVTTPDVGADEGTFIASDIFGPAITYTALGNTNSTTDRNLTAAITDLTGVDVSPANGPRAYYKKGALGTYRFSGVVSSSGSNFTFTLRSDSLGSLAPGDTIFYYVAAQDVAGTPNSSTSPGGGSGINPPGTTPTASPNKYIIISPPLSGTYTVGLTLFNRITGKNLVPVTMTRTVKREVPAEQDSREAEEKGNMPSSTAVNDKRVKTELKEVTETYQVLMENGVPYTSNERAEVTREQLVSLGLGSMENMVGVYPTITAAVNDLTLRGVQGPVTFTLLDASYPTETYPITMNSIPGVNALNNITLKPASGVTTSISGSSASGPMFRIVNTNYVTIDGSNSGGTTRDLTFTNTSTTSPSLIGIGSSGTTPITNVTVKNCVLINGVNTATALIISDGTTWGNAGYSSNIIIQNNSIQKSYMGVYCTGGTTPQNASNISYLNNVLTSTGANQMRYTGLYMQGVTGGLISGNQIANFESATSEVDNGVWLATGTTNTIVEKNTIDSLAYTGTSGYGARGVTISSGLANCNNIIRNNMIYGLRGDADSYLTYGAFYSPVGIIAFGVGQGGIKIYNNSIYLYGNSLNYGANSYSIGIALDSLVTGEIRNNAIVNNLGLLSTTGAGPVCIAAKTSISQFTGLSNNVYFLNSTNGTKVIGKINNTNYTTLPGWVTATGKDYYSINADPQFMAIGNLHINTGVPTPVERAGTVLSDVTGDYDGDSRNLTYPDIGADEGSFMVQDLTPPVITYTLLTSPGETDNAGVRSESNTDNNEGYRELTASITDNTLLQAGLPNAPRMYYKKGALGTYKFGNPVSSAGNNYTFRVLYNDSLGGVTSGDSIFYYVAAQDTAANSITNPLGGGGSNPPGTTAPASVNFFRVSAAPSVPVLVSPANNSVDIPLSVTLDWGDIAGAKMYRVQVATDSAFSNVIKDTNGVLTSQFLVQPGTLSTGTAYYWRTNATNEGGITAYSAAFKFTTVPAPPAAPVLVTPSNGQINVSVTPTLDWNDVSGAVTYRVQVATDAGFSSIVKDSSGLTASQFSIAAGVLGGNTQYYWRVNGTNTGGTGVYSPAFSFTTVPAPPAVPVLVTPSNGATDVSLTPLMDWNNVASASSYRIQIASDAAFTTLIKDTSGILTSQYQVLPGALSVNTVYYWRVSASNPGGSSALSSAFSFTTVPNAPAAPSLLAPANNAVNISVNPSFDWSDVTAVIDGSGKSGSGKEEDAVTTYRLQISADSNFTTMFKDTSGLGASQYTLTGTPLANNTKYYWRVSATNAGGTSVFTSRFTFTTVPSAPGVPVLTSPANNASGVPLTPLFDWNDVSGASSYRIQISTDSSFITTLKDTSGVLSSQYQAAGGLLAVNTRYYWRVNATNAGGTSAFAGRFTFTTSPPPPAQVTFTVIPGGLYNSGTGRLNMRDTVKVFLIDSASCSKVDSARGVIDSVTFSATLSFGNASSGNYYLFVYHRNHVAIATRLTQNVVRGSTVSYNFTTDSAKAFGNNMMKLATGIWGMIPGDANRDGFVDGLDQTIWIIQNGLDGYNAGDFNGDGFVDGLDQTIWIVQNGQSFVLPCQVLDLMLNIRSFETTSPGNTKSSADEQKRNLRK